MHGRSVSDHTGRWGRCSRAIDVIGGGGAGEEEEKEEAAAAASEEEEEEEEGTPGPLSPGGAFPRAEEMEEMEEMEEIPISSMPPPILAAAAAATTATATAATTAAATAATTAAAAAATTAAAAAAASCAPSAEAPPPNSLPVASWSPGELTSGGELTWSAAPPVAEARRAQGAPRPASPICESPRFVPGVASVIKRQPSIDHQLAAATDPPSAAVTPGPASAARPPAERSAAAQPQPPQRSASKLVAPSTRRPENVLKSSSSKKPLSMNWRR